MFHQQPKTDAFETARPHLTAVATRLLGSVTEADDAVQEAWLRYDRAADDEIENAAAWLTTVVSRICLDHLRARSRFVPEHEDYGQPERGDDDAGPEDIAILSESSAEALGLILDTLSPLERVAFVLHDVFAVPFDEVAAVIDRSQVATRQLASRARRRVREERGQTTPRANPNREIVAAFFSAAREGRMQDLLSVLAPNVVLRADRMTQQMGVPAQRLGAQSVAENFFGGAVAARLALIDGQYGAFWMNGGQIRVVFRFTIESDQIAAIDMLAEPEAVAAMDIQPAIVRHRTSPRPRDQAPGCGVESPSRPSTIPQT